MSERSGGQLVAETLAALGVDHVFAVPGESYLEVLDGLIDVADRVRLVTCRFEAAAAHMAEACGKLTGRPGVAMVTRGPGACHAAIGVHVAFQDSSPMLLLVGQIPRLETDRESFQEIDYRRMFAPVAKWVTQIDDAARIPELLAHAFDVAVSGRPGPVVVALAEEMQAARTDVALPVSRRVLTGPPSAVAMAELAERIEASARPLVVLGGLWGEAARTRLGAVLRESNLPVAVGFRRQALYDNRAANYAGDLGVGADPALVAAAREADLVVALGTRLGEPVTQGYTLFTDRAAPPVIHVYPEASEIGRVVRPVLGIAAALDDFAAAARPWHGRWDAWTARLRGLRDASRAIPDYPHPLNLAAVMRKLEGLLDPDAIVTSDAGNFATWAPRFVDFADGQRYIGPTNGAMGYAVPAAIGAAIRFPGRMVVALVGDGGMLMTGQEVATAFHEGAAPIVIVFNNNMYGTIRMYQERAHPGRVSATALTNPDFARLIEAFGGHGEVVAETAAFEGAFRRARASGRPALIELRTDPRQITSRTRL